MEAPPTSNIGWTFRPAVAATPAGTGPRPTWSAQAMPAQAMLQPLQVQSQAVWAGTECPYTEQTGDLMEVSQIGLQLLPPSADVEKLQAKCSELRRALDISQRQAAAHQQQVESMQHAMRAMQQQNDHLQAQMLELRQNVQLLGGNFQGRLTIVQGSVVAELQRELASRSQQCSALQEEVSSMHEQLQQVTREAAATAEASEAERQRLAAEVGQCRLMCMSRGRQLQALQTQLHQVQADQGVTLSHVHDAEVEARCQVQQLQATLQQTHRECAAHVQRSSALQTQLQEEQEARALAEKELAKLRGDVRDMALANECLEASLAEIESGAPHVALQQLRAENRRLQEAAAAERHELQEALAGVQAEARSASHQVRYLQELSSMASRAGAVPAVQHQPQQLLQPESSESPERAGGGLQAPGQGSDPGQDQSPDRCCEQMLRSSITSNRAYSTGGTDRDERWPARVAELMRQVQRLEQQLCDEVEHSAGLQRLVGSLQEQLQQAFAQPQELQHTGVAQAGGAHAPGAAPGSSSTSATAPQLLTHSLRSLFSSDDDDDGPNGQGTGSCFPDDGAMGSPGAAAWPFQTAEGDCAAFSSHEPAPGSPHSQALNSIVRFGTLPCCDAEVQTDTPHKEPDRGLAGSGTADVLAAAREEIERLKELNAKLLVAKDPKRFVSLEDVRVALVEVRETAKRQADEAVVAVSAAAAARHEALQQEHSKLLVQASIQQQELQQLRIKLEGAEQALQQLEACQQRVQHLERQLAERQAELQQQLEQQLSAVRRELEAKEAAALAEQQAALAAVSEQQLERLRELLGAEHAQQLAGAEQQLQQAHEACAQELQRLREAHATEVQELAAAHKSQLAQLQGDLAAVQQQAMDELRKQLEADAAAAASQLQAEGAERERALCLQHTEELERLFADCREAQQQRAEALQAAEEAAAAKQASEKTAQQLLEQAAALKAQLAELRDEQARGRQALEERQACAMDQHEAQLAELAQQLREAHDADMRQLAEAAVSEVQDAQAATDAAVDEAQRRAASDLIALQSRHEDTIRSLEAAHAVALEETRHEANQLVQDLERRLAEAQEAADTAQLRAQQVLELLSRQQQQPAGIARNDHWRRGMADGSASAALPLADRTNVCQHAGASYDSSGKGHAEGKGSGQLGELLRASHQHAGHVPGDSCRYASQQGPCPSSLPGPSSGAVGVSMEGSDLVLLASAIKPDGAAASSLTSSLQHKVAPQWQGFGAASASSVGLLMPPITSTSPSLSNREVDQREVERWRAAVDQPSSAIQAGAAAGPGSRSVARQLLLPMPPQLSTAAASAAATEVPSAEASSSVAAPQAAGGWPSAEVASNGSRRSSAYDGNTTSRGRSQPHERGAGDTLALNALSLSRAHRERSLAQEVAAAQYAQAAAQHEACMHALRRDRLELQAQAAAQHQEPASMAADLALVPGRRSSCSMASGSLPAPLRLAAGAAPDASSSYQAGSSCVRGQVHAAASSRDGVGQERRRTVPDNLLHGPPRGLPPAGSGAALRRRTDGLERARGAEASGADWLRAGTTGPDAAAGPGLVAPRQLQQHAQQWYDRQAGPVAQGPADVGAHASRAGAGMSQGPVQRIVGLADLGRLQQ